MRDEFDAANVFARRLDDDADVRDDSLNAAVKWLKQLDNDHSLVSGFEAEGTSRNELRTTIQTTPAGGTVPLYDDLGDNFTAGTSRVALYTQDEWNVDPNWAAHAGIRWEGISTRADAGGSGAAASPAHNRSSVITPIAHAVWKPDPNGRDQVRISLTRSYKSPTLNNLIGRPSVSSRFPVDGPINDATSPDRVGNPDLKPELATGIDHLNGVAVTASADPEAVELFFLHRGCWQQPRRFSVSGTAGPAVSLDRRLGELVAGAQWTAVTGRRRQEMTCYRAAPRTRLFGTRNSGGAGRLRSAASCCG
jgi:hypothetical protein